MKNNLLTNIAAPVIAGSVLAGCQAPQQTQEPSEVSREHYSSSPTYSTEIDQESLDNTRELVHLLSTGWDGLYTPWTSGDTKVQRTKNKLQVWAPNNHFLVHVTRDPNYRFDLEMGLTWGNSFQTDFGADGTLDLTETSIGYVNSEPSFDDQARAYRSNVKIALELLKERQSQ